MIYGSTNILKSNKSRHDPASRSVSMISRNYSTKPVRHTAPASRPRVPPHGRGPIAPRCWMSKSLISTVRPPFGKIRRRTCDHHSKESPPPGSAFERNDTLESPGLWTTAGVSGTRGRNGSHVYVRALVAAGPSGRRFVRLRVTAPP